MRRTIHKYSKGLLWVSIVVIAALCYVGRWRLLRGKAAINNAGLSHEAPVVKQPLGRPAEIKDSRPDMRAGFAGIPADRLAILIGSSVESRYVEALGLLAKGGAENDAKALEYFELGASLGDPRCALEAARMLEKGRGSPYDSRAVYKYYMIAASAGDSGAELRVADLIAGGVGTRVDYIAAGYWYEKAARDGQAIALLSLGRLFANGQGYPQDHAIALEYYRKAQAAGVRAADAAIGVAMINGWGMPADTEGGVALLARSASNGVVESAFALSQIYQQGAGAAGQDKAKALDWMHKAAEAGYPEAQRILGQGFITGNWGVQDLNDAKYWLTKAGEQGDAQALADLGNIISATKDGYAEAYDLAQKSAAVGNPSGAFLLAQLSAYRKLDDPEAQHYVAKAAENGDWRSMYVQNLLRQGLTFNEAVKLAANSTQEDYQKFTIVTEKMADKDLIFPTPISLAMERPPAAITLGGFSGTVNVRFRVSANGRPENIVVLDSPSAEVEKYLTATVAKWTFSPASRKGVPAPQEITYPIFFPKTTK